MGLVINGIYCDELVNGYTESADIMGGYSARKGYICDWNSRFVVVHGILGLSSTVSIGGNITLNTPMPYPELIAESQSALASNYARSVEMYGVGPPFQNTYTINGKTYTAW